MSEKIQLDDIISSTPVPNGVDKEIAIIANTDSYELNLAILDSLSNHFESSGLGTVDNRLYGVAYAARIFDVKEKLARPMRRTAILLGAVAMGGSMTLAVEEYGAIQKTVSTQSVEVAKDSQPISQSDLDKAGLVLGGLGFVSGLLAGNMFGKILTDDEARRRAKKIVKKQSNT